MITRTESDQLITLAIRKTRQQAASTHLNLQKQIGFLKERLLRTEGNSNKIVDQALYKSRHQIEKQQFQLEAAKQKINALSKDLQGAAKNIDILQNRVSQLNQTIASQKYQITSFEEQISNALMNQKKTQSELITCKNELMITKKELRDHVTKKRIEAAKVFRNMNKKIGSNIDQMGEVSSTVVSLTGKPVELLKETPAVQAIEDEAIPSPKQISIKSTPNLINGSSAKKQEQNLVVSPSPTSVETLDQLSIKSVSSSRTAFTVTFNGSLGVQIGDNGVIEKVNIGSSADDAGVQVGDTIAFVDSVPITHVFAHTDTPNAREVGAALNRAKRQQGFVKIRFRPSKI